MNGVEPLAGHPVAVGEAGQTRALIVGDFHAGYEVALKYERGVDVPSKASKRRERLLALLEETGVSELVFLGDVMHSIGEPGGAERGELEVLFESIPSSISVTVVKGNHDGDIESWLDSKTLGDHHEPTPDVRILPGSGGVIGDGSIGVCHGHTWPTDSVLEADVICLGHEHPFVRLEDEVGGYRVEPVWLRGRLDPAPFREHGYDDGIDAFDSDTGAEILEAETEIVVFPAFNDLVGGTWVNVEGQSFLSPFLPAALASGDLYLLDGTRLGPYQSV